MSVALLFTDAIDHTRANSDDVDRESAGASSEERGTKSSDGHGVLSVDDGDLLDRIARALDEDAVIGPEAGDVESGPLSGVGVRRSDSRGVNPGEWYDSVRSGIGELAQDLRLPPRSTLETFRAALIQPERRDEFIGGLLGYGLIGEVGRVEHADVDDVPRRRPAGLEERTLRLVRVADGEQP